MLKQKHCVSERRACRAINQPRSTQRHRFADESTDSILIRQRVIALAKKIGRYGYRRIWALLKTEGFHVNVKRIYRIWRQEGLKVPSKQPKRARLWLNDGSCIRLRPEYRNHVWSYDFVEDKTHDGRKIRMLNIIDEYTRECLAIRVRRKLNSRDVLMALSKLFIQRGVPDYVRSDNGAEFVAKIVRKWFADTEVKTLYIAPGSPWENGYCESFNGKLQDELLKGEIFYTLKEEQILIERWRVEYNTIRPHSSLGYRPPAPETLTNNQTRVDFKYVS